VSVRSGALRRLRLYAFDGAHSEIEFDETAYCALLGANVEIDSDRLRFVYSSLTTPATTYDFVLAGGERVLLKREPVLGDFDPRRYRTELRWATGCDGERIPVSLLYRSDLARDGTAPLYQYAYGSYGHCIDPSFSSTQLSLVDRGFVFAIAHVRGGQELGRRWYEAGRLERKMNSFNDFIDVTDFLVAEKYAARDKVFAVGGSAGGLLVGAVANIAPERYRGMVAQVPFVDVVTTMLDESIPLTTLEYDEWGNPNERAAYDTMLAYSPYDNVRAQAYPAILVTAGLWDSQVQYFEPAKWVAKLRALKTDDRPLYLYMDMEAGHGGKSGRLQRYREIALEYAFVTSEAGITR
ncbi:MAG TPA: prolyl oligopeptidase family serine peptidase, partial [Roseiflexaceae bacterium]|nr:prolyl oligopeptidase family serine peptidase [Roseiflexaceae bacterium]